jgi:hypothetical protein
MLKVDIKKEYGKLYSPSSKEVSLVEIPPMNFIMIDGKGDPSTAVEYRNSIEALYSLAYTLKFSIKKGKDIDFGVMPLEGLWWADDMNDFITGNKDRWKWTSMIMQPEYVTEEMFYEAQKQVAGKKDLPALSDARFVNFKEGRAVQIMHIGPYKDEGPNIEKLHNFAREHNYSFDGLKQKHHEIYLSDPRKAAPDKMRTIVRQPVIAPEN